MFERIRTRVIVGVLVGLAMWAWRYFVEWWQL